MPMDCTTSKVNDCEKEKSCCCGYEQLEKEQSENDCCSNESQQNDATPSQHMASTASIPTHIEYHNNACVCGTVSNANMPVSQSRHAELLNQQNAKEKHKEFSPQTVNQFYAPSYKAVTSFSFQLKAIPYILMEEKVCLRI
jgi:hypothetical protein